MLSAQKVLTTSLRLRDKIEVEALLCSKCPETINKHRFFLYFFLLHPYHPPYTHLHIILNMNHHPPIPPHPTSPLVCGQPTCGEVIPAIRVIFSVWRSIGEGVWRRPDKSSGGTKFVLKKNDLIIQIRSGDWGLDRGLLLEGGEGSRQSRQEDVRGKAISTLGSSLVSSDNGLKHFAFRNLGQTKTTKVWLQSLKINQVDNAKPH